MTPTAMIIALAKLTVPLDDGRRGPDADARLAAAIVSALEWRAVEE